MSENSNSKYATTKYNGEKEVKKFDDYCIIRSSIIYGDEDNFINFFARLSKISLFLPLIGGGKNLFQPIWVCKNIIIIVRKNIKNKILEIGGEETFSFRSILEIILRELELKRKLIPIPFSLSKNSHILKKLPKSVLTVDQVEMLKKTI